MRNHQSRLFVIFCTALTFIVMTALSPLFLVQGRQQVLGLEYLLYALYYFCLISGFAALAAGVSRRFPRVGAGLIAVGWIYLLIGSLVYFHLGLQLDSSSLIGALKMSGLNGVQFGFWNWIYGLGGSAFLIMSAFALNRWFTTTSVLQVNKVTLRKIERRWFAAVLIGLLYLGVFEFGADQRLLPGEALPGYAWLARFKNEGIIPIAATTPNLTGSEMKRKPDFVFLLADSVRWDLITAETAPNLDRLQKSGECLESRAHYAGGHMTAYGGFSALYGLNSYNYPAYARAKISSAALLALKKNGYEMQAFDASGLLIFTPPAVKKDDFDRYQLIAAHTPAVKDDQAVADGIIQALKAESKTPQFLFVFFYSTHDPYEFVGNGLPSRSDDLPDSTDLGLKERFRQYRSSLRYVDGLVGKILEAAASKANAGELAFVFSSDHGEEFGEHGSSGHVKVGYEDARTRVPLIFCLPDRKVSDVPLSSHSDIFPTFFSWAGVDKGFLKQFDGVSLIEQKRKNVIVAPSQFPTDERSVAVFREGKKYRFELTAKALSSLKLKSVYQDDRERVANRQDEDDSAGDLNDLKALIRSRLRFPDSSDPADSQFDRQPAND